MELNSTIDAVERGLLHAAIACFCVGAGAIGFVIGQKFGGAAGEAKARLEQKAQALDAVQTMLLSHTQLVAASQEASVELRTAATQRQETNNKTTEELRDALKETAASRAGCHLDAASLQLIQTAASRAAAATTPARASGGAGAVPATAAAAKR